MSADVTIAIAREAILVLLKIGAPVMLIALIVGLLVALLQALTQLQEMTLAFVPKILAIFVTVILVLPFMLAALTTFAEGLYARIAGLE